LKELESKMMREFELRNFERIGKQNDETIWLTHLESIGKQNDEIVFIDIC
jgi:hypothetical protein